MKIKRLGNKGNLIHWVLALVLALGLMVVYTATYKMMHTYFPTALERIGANTSSSTYIVLINAYDYFPIIFVIGVFVWAIAAGQKNEYDRYY